jgi:hypothetical protein
LVEEIFGALIEEIAGEAIGEAIEEVGAESDESGVVSDTRTEVFDEVTDNLGGLEEELVGIIVGPAILMSDELLASGGIVVSSVNLLVAVLVLETGGERGGTETNPT